MGFSLLLYSAVKCFGVLAWPLFALGYPLCSSIQAIELDSISDIRKLVTYWVLFSLISLFDHAFARLLEWLPFWPYAKLMVIFWLVVPHFDGSIYVYEKHVRPCFSINAHVVLEWWNKRKVELFPNKENFLVAAERYVTENGIEALERLIAGKCTQPNVDEKEIKAIAASEKTEVGQLKCKDPNVAQKDIKVVEVTVKNDVAGTMWVKFKEPNVAQKEIKAVDVTEKKEVAGAKWLDCNEPNVAQKEIKAVEVTGKKDVPAAKLFECKEPNVVQKEIKAVEVTDRKQVAGVKWVKQTELNLDQTENRTFTAAGNDETLKTAAATAGSGSKLPKILDSEKVQREWTCALCQVTTPSEITLNSHLQGKRHKAASDELKAKNWAAKKKVSPASTANYKKSDQPREETKKCVSSSGSDQKNTGNQVNVFGKQQNPNKTSVVNIKQSTLWCNICNIRCPGEIDMACHLNGRKHFARIQELNGFAGGWD